MVRTFVRNQGVEGAPMRDESILFVPESESYCVLNQSATALWEALEAPATESDLAATLAERFEGATVEAVLDDVRAALEQMEEMSLVKQVTE